MKTIRITVSLPEQIYKLLLELSRKDRRTKSNYLAWLIEQASK
jgi:predicted DNA-binding protein